MRQLTNQEINFFRLSGYLILAWKFDAEFINDVAKILDQHLDSQVPPFKKDTKQKIIKLYNLIERHELFNELYTSRLIIEPLKSLLGPNIEFLKNRHNHASVIRRGNKEKRFHRDVLHWSRPAIGVLIYPQDTNINNGCTEIIPCSHYLQFVPPTNSPQHGGTWMDDFKEYNGFQKQAVPIIMEKGGILFFDTLAFHSPGINRTLETRYAITAAYHAVDELQPVEENKNKLLVSGKRVYCGNEESWEF